MFYKILKKELKNFIRDKKGLISFVILPIFMYLYLFNIDGIMGNLLDKPVKDMEGVKIKIIAEKDDWNYPLINEIKSIDKNMEVIVSTDTKGDNNESYNLVLTFEEGFSNKLQSGNTATIEIYKKSMDLVDKNYEKIRDTIQNFEKNLVKDTITNKGVNINILDIYNVKSENISDISEEQAGFFYVIPMFILLFPLTIGMQVVVELCSTEKERGTLEAILTTKAKRGTIIGAKYVALLILVLGEIFISLGAFILVSKGFSTDLINLNSLNGGTISIMIIMIILTYIGISLVQFIIGLYARNFKEAQGYMTGMMLILLILNYVFIFVDIKNVSEIFLHIPILNSITVLNEILLGILNIRHLAIVFIWLILYIVIIGLVAIKTVFKEEVLLRK